MAIALVAATIGQSATTNGFTTAAIDTSGASVLEVVIADYAGAAASTFADSKTNSWSQVGSTVTGSLVRLRRYRASGSIVVGAGHTVTVTVTAGYPACSFSSWSDVASSPNDQWAGAAPGSGTTESPGPITPSVNDCLILSAAAMVQPSMTLSIDDGYSILHQAANISGTAFGLGVGYLVQTTATVTDPEWTWSGTDNDRACDITSLKPGGGPPPAGGKPWTYQRMMSA